jgi:PhoPQ-activated pathogenicity-related protein
MKIEEPYEYRDRLTLPKFIINATGDQFFLPDSSQFYFKDLRGPKYLRYVPNGDHSLRETDAFETVVTCYNAILTKTPLPRFSWTMQPDRSLRVEVNDKPAREGLDGLYGRIDLSGEGFSGTVQVYHGRCGDTGDAAV